MPNRKRFCMPALKWLRLLMNHIPDKYEQQVRYCGYYSNRARGGRQVCYVQTLGREVRLELV